MREPVPRSVLSRLVERLRASPLRAVWQRVRDRRAAPGLAGAAGLPAAAQLVAVQHPSATLPERPYDLLLLAAVLGLLGIGTIEIYSATAADRLTQLRRRHALPRAPARLVGVGGLAMWLGARHRLPPARELDLSAARRSARAARRRRCDRTRTNGAKRWIPLGPLTFQPVEIAKLALVTYLAYSLGRKADQVKTFTVGFVPHLVVCGMMMVLLLKQPDLGSSDRARRDHARHAVHGRHADLVHHARGARRRAGRVSLRRRHAVAAPALPRVLQPRGVREQARPTSSCRRGSRWARAG